MVKVQKRKNKTRDQDRNGKPRTRRSQRAAKAAAEFDPQAVLSAARIENVPICEIDTHDHTFMHRAAICPPCDADDLDVEDGVLDFADGVHPIVVLHRDDTKRYRPVSGFGRLEVAKDSMAVKSVRCLVLSNVPAPAVATLAARSNLTHGQPLSTAEKRTCFRRELEASKAGGFLLPATKALARAYGVSKNTIKRWLQPPEPKAQTGPPPSDAAASTASVNQTAAGVSPTGTQAAGLADRHAAIVAPPQEPQIPEPGFDDALAWLAAAVDDFFLSVNGLDVAAHDRRKLSPLAVRLRAYAEGDADFQGDVA